MEITEIKVFPVGEEKLKAFVSVVFDHCFMVNDIKVIQGREGLFISMPSRRKKNGQFKDVAHPLNNETRRRIESQILGEYERLTGSSGARPEPAAAVAEHATVETGGYLEPTAEGVTAPEPPQERSLEEIAEMHLKDSYWTS
jgi:stage V sporulation protein G